MRRIEFILQFISLNSKRIKKALKKILLILGIGMVLLLIATIVAISYGLSYLNRVKSIPDNSILQIYFADDINEKSKPFNHISKYLYEEEASVNFRQTLELIEAAAKDDQIAAIEISGKSKISHTKAIEIKRALEKFKETSNKPIYAYGDYYNQGAYILSTVADSIFLAPMGKVDFKGYRAIFAYFKDLMDRYDIEVEVFKAGKFKSYVESYTRTEMSEENRSQFTAFLDSLMTELKYETTCRRQLSPTRINQILETNGGGNASSCLQLGLVDQLLYSSDYKEKIEKNIFKDQGQYITLSRYLSSRYKNKSNAPNVAYVVLEGVIEENGTDVNLYEMRKAFQEIRENKDIKVIVFRINSGGGSAFVSDEIHHEVALCREAGIPVISSISTSAASGGYYACANSDKIYASRNSLVGSIGAFIVFPSFEKALKKHVGIDFDDIQTTDFSQRINGITALTEAQKNFYLNDLENLYSRFKSIVSEGRDISLEQVEEIAQGKIYNGLKAKELGLIDGLKDLEEIFAEIQKDYDIPKLRLKEYPRSKMEYLPKFDINVMLKQTSLKNKNDLIRKGEQQLDTYLNLLAEPKAVLLHDFFWIDE